MKLYLFGNALVNAENISPGLMWRTEKSPIPGKYWLYGLLKYWDIEALDRDIYTDKDSLTSTIKSLEERFKDKFENFAVLGYR
ncbi:MAG: hypothetical protein AABW83_00005 [Nanoarchaeota archaeon]